MKYKNEKVQERTKNKVK